MKLKKMSIPNKIGNKLNKTSFILKKHSPEILIIAGITGTIVSTVMACKATTKVNSILDESKETLNRIKEETAKDVPEKYSQEDAKKDIAIVYFQTGLKVAKVYAPAIMLGTLSISSILASNNIMKKRNMALAAAYTAIDTSFKEYRGRVAERFGNEVEKELRFNVKAKKFEETVLDENGKEKKVKTTVNVTDVDGVSEYARFFDRNCGTWERDPEYNMMFLKAQQNYANDKLKAKGILFLNEVYEMLGIRWFEDGELISKSKAGQIVGWVYNPESADTDNYVDFGIFETARETENGGFERTILLDFNVDGDIWSLM